MSLALIEESAKEVRRLAIAGSPMAVGDFRLKKLIAPLEQAGAKAPVFGQVAKAITELVNGREEDSAGRLLGVSTLLNAILYTQGQTGGEGECRELDLVATRCSSTKTTARVLKPLVEALTSTGSGRFEIVKAALERGAFNDIRLVEPAVRALDDVYPELADLVADKILPMYGAGIRPLLKQNLNLKGKKSDGRRLSILHRLDPEGTLELCKQALEEGSTEVKIAALECLGQHEECLPLVLEQGNSKNKEIRRAALRAMAQYDRAEIAQFFLDLITSGKSLELLGHSFGAMRNRQVVDALLAEGNRVLNLLLKKEEAQIPRFLDILNCLEQRKDAAAAQFILKCFEQGDQLVKLKPPKNLYLSGADLVERLTSLVYRLDSPQALESILARRVTLPPGAFEYALPSALRTWPAEKFYQEFAPLLQQTKGPGKEKSQALHALMWSALNSGDSDDEVDLEALGLVDADVARLKSCKWDPRWLDAAIKADVANIVCLLTKPGDTAAHNYLLKKLDKSDAVITPRIIETLARCQHPNITDVFLGQVSKKAKRYKSHPWDLLSLLESARHLPPDDLPKLETFAGKLDEKLVDHFLEAIQPLREVKPAGQP